jgi:hypothetical protein
MTDDNSETREKCGIAGGNDTVDDVRSALDDVDGDDGGDQADE